MKKKEKMERRVYESCAHENRSSRMRYVLILPESALRRRYYPLFPDDTAAAEMLNLVTEKRTIVLQRDLRREATIF